MEREDIRFQSFYWLASLTRERHKHQPGLELPMWERQRMRACCLRSKPASEASRPAEAQRSQGWGRCHQAWRWDNQGGLGRSRFLRRARGSVLMKQKGTAGTPQRKKPSSFNPPESSQNSCLTQIQSKCTLLESQKYHLLFLSVES